MFNKNSYYNDCIWVFGGNETNDIYCYNLTSNSVIYWDTFNSSYNIQQESFPASLIITDGINDYIYFVTQDSILLKYYINTKTLDKLEEVNRKSKSLNNNLKEDNNNLKRTVLLLKDKLEESVVTNAKLLYSNRVLLSASLNERQKQHIVEALANAHSVDEAKTIYETLQRSSTGTASSAPQSLNEALTRNSGRSSILPRGRKKKETINENAMERLQRLAGIK